MMNLELVTKQDFEAFKQDLLQELKVLMNQPLTNSSKEWLKNCEVKKMLRLSSSTLQRLRISGQIRSCKIGGTHYYRYQDLLDLLANGTKQ